MTEREQFLAGRQCVRLKSMGDGFFMVLTSKISAIEIVERLPESGLPGFVKVFLSSGACLFVDKEDYETLIGALKEFGWGRHD